jgi:hypothetical protein
MLSKDLNTGVRKLSLWLAKEGGATVTNESNGGLPTPALGQLSPTEPPPKPGG